MRTRTPSPRGTAARARRASRAPPGLTRATVRWAWNGRRSAGSPRAARAGRSRSTSAATAPEPAPMPSQPACARLPPGNVPAPSSEIAKARASAKAARPASAAGAASGTSPRKARVTWSWPAAGNESRPPEPAASRSRAWAAAAAARARGGRGRAKKRRIDRMVGPRRRRRGPPGCRHARRCWLTLADLQRAARGRVALALALLVASAALLASPLRGHVDDTDAQLYQALSRNMAARGAWLEPGPSPGSPFPFREHLPFGLVPQVAVVRILGEGALFVPGLVFSAGTVLLVFLLGARLTSARAGAAAALLLARHETVLLYGGAPA